VQQGLRKSIGGGGAEQQDWRMISMRHKLIGLGATSSLLVAGALWLVAGGASQISATPITPRAELGVNAVSPRWYSRTRAYANLLIGNGWQIGGPSFKRWENFPKSDLDSDGWITTLAPENTAYRSLSHPRFTIGSSKITCTFDGKGTVSVSALRNITSVTARQRSLSFDWKVASNWPEGTDILDNVYLKVQEMDPSDPVRNVDCREAGLAKDSRFTPGYIRSFEGYAVIRYMDLQDTNRNAPVTWETRKRTSSSLIPDVGGLPIEDIVLLSNATGTSPWVCLPWNSDDAYLRNFAVYLRDNLKPGLKVYVEMGNEVWNPTFSVSKQARLEGLQALLSDNPREAQLKRYAQRSVEALKIWTEVFESRKATLVRVVATQHANPSSAEIVLTAPGLAPMVDALATAPYFGHELAKLPESLTADEAFAAMELSIEKTIDYIGRNASIAKKYGKRYITYEGGQHIVLPKNVPLTRQLNRDPRIGALYTKLLESWQRESPDLFTHFADTGPTTRFGSWGLREYLGQPIDQSPKAKAVQPFLAK
jgi:hypothetical protein